MAKLRKFVAYRRLERPYTRKSKYRKKSYIKASPNIKIVRFDMGDLKKEFSHTLKLNAKETLQIRHNAFESARQTSNKYLETKLGKTGYHMKINTYPHHILRENPLASGAGADRMSTGMKMSFGKAIGLAARIKKGQTLFSVSVQKDNLTVAKEALRRCRAKLPCTCIIDVVENNKA